MLYENLVHGCMTSVRANGPLLTSQNPIGDAAWVGQFAGARG